MTNKLLRGLGSHKPSGIGEYMAKQKVKTTRYSAKKFRAGKYNNKVKNEHN